MLEKYQKLKNTSRKVWDTAGIAGLLQLQRTSAKVVIQRMIERGFLVRLKRDLFCLQENLYANTFQIANRLYMPSYISLLSALNFRGITTQAPRDVFSITRQRSTNYDLTAVGLVFQYRWVPERYFFGYEERDGIIVAFFEKALLDLFYVSEEAVDTDSLNLTAINKDRLQFYLQNYSKRFRERFSKAFGEIDV